MARANLRGLIGNLGDTETSTRSTESIESEESATRSEMPETSPESSTPHSDTPRHKVAQTPRDLLPTRFSEGVGPAHFSDFQRKETRLRSDQQDALTEHARRLNRTKGVGGRRITDNTLIRVAVDLLLSKADKLAGSDEAALRRSLGLKGTEL
jgi:hypothetical protein